MLIKLGVSIANLRRPMRKALSSVEAAYASIANEEAVITSTFEGTHSVSSLHYVNLAVDFRLPKTKQVLKDIIEYLKTTLGKSYDILESTNCLHIEWDPK